MKLLRLVEVGIANGKALPQACKEAGIVEQTCYRLAEGIRRVAGKPGGRGTRFTFGDLIQGSEMLAEVLPHLQVKIVPPASIRVAEIL